MPAGARRRDIRDTEWFIDELRAVSPGNLRALWIPSPSDATTNIRRPDGLVWTNSATVQGRISYLGNGVIVSYNGSSQSATTPNSAALTFGNGTVDSAFSGAAFANVTDSAAVRTMFARAEFGVSVDYDFRVDGADALQLLLTDFGAATCNRRSDAAITQGTPQLFGFSYTGAGGATAANGITLYVNGNVAASTATNSGSYVSMNGTAVTTNMGMNTNDQHFGGSIGFCAIYAGALSAAQHRAISDLCRVYYEVAL